jgi:hypothetical protein
MDQTISRKQFFVLTFTLIGSAAAAGCSDSGGSTTGAGGSGGPVTCDDPLGTAQLSDSTGHNHTLTVPASVLQATGPQMFTTSTGAGHTHTVTLSMNQLMTISNGTPVMVNSSSDNNHTHTYRVSCQA